MVKLLAAVGAGGTNAQVDVKAVQNLLNQSIRTITPLAPLKVTGICDSLTIEAITQFQRRVVRLPAADGRIDPGGQTLQALITTASGGTFQPGLGPVAGVPAAPAHKPGTPYTDNPNEAVTKTTKPDVQQVITLARAGWSDLNAQGARTLAAQCLHETKNGDNCFNWNLGNVKTLSDRVLHMYLRNVWELASAHAAAAEVEKGNGLAHIATGAELAKYNHGSKMVVVFQPPHPYSRFLAFPTLADGVTYWLSRHKKVAANHSTYVQAVNAGDCKLIAHFLKMDRYYTGLEGDYANAMLIFKTRIDRAFGSAK